MILTPADVSSLAITLTRWEYAEYFFTALVVLACFGEYIASFTDWFTAGDERRKKRLEKRSTLLLIGALSLELVCLVKTNELSGRLIGSLDDRSRSAVEQSERAEDKSSVAERTASKAVASSEKASGAASTALRLATGARKEADSFERDIVSAKEIAASAESHLAEALKEAAKAQRDLNELKAPRVLSPEQQGRIAAKLRRLSGQKFDLNVYPDSEPMGLAATIDAALKAAGWVRVPSQSGDVVVEVAGETAGQSYLSGIEAFISPEDSASVQALLALSAALSAEGLPCIPHKTDQLKGKTPLAILIAVGSKPK